MSWCRDSSEAPNALTHRPLQLVHDSAHDPNALLICTPTLGQKAFQCGFHGRLLVSIEGCEFSLAVRDHLRRKVVTHAKSWKKLFDRSGRL